MKTNNYSDAVITYKESNQVDLDALNKIASGSIAGLIKCSYKCENKHHCFIFENDNCSPLSLAENISFKETVRILLTFNDLLQNIANNNMNINNLLLSKKYIFKSDLHYGFIYIPLAKTKKVTLKKTYLKLLSVINCKDSRISELKKAIKKSKEENKLTEIINSYIFDFSEDETPVSSEGETTLLSNDETTVLSEDETTLLSNEETTVLSENETTLLSNEETTVLNTNNRSGQENIVNNRLSLVRTGNGEKIDIDYLPFTLGSEQNGADYVISNESISRRHATVILEKGNYYIVDNNSTNGTTVEGVKLQPNERAEVGNGYIITLGNEHFQSHIESR